MEQKEPSMEEILSSIRRILSNEESEQKGQTPEEPAPTEMQENPQPVVELTEEMMIDNQTSHIEEDLVSEPAVQASADSLSELAKVIHEEKETAPATSLEDLVTQLLKPYLKEWLDSNLPALIEKVVQKEVRRIMDRADLS